MNKNILVITFLALATSLSAQISSVQYSLKYNSSTCLFDVYLNVDKGHTKKLTDRAQFNSQVTLVTPKGSLVSVEENFMPLRDNQSYRSEEAASWESTSVVDGPESAKALAFHSFTPFLSPTAFYNDLNVGDEVKLFSISVEPMVNCAADIRLFDNKTDPTSSASGMRGGDFSNGFTMGGISQLYAGNAEIVIPTSPSIENFQVLSSKEVSVNFNVNANNASDCQKGLTYEWIGPNGVISNDKSAPKLTYTQANSGNYSLVVTDGLGCKAEKVIKINNGKTLEDKTGLEGSGEGVVLNTEEVYKTFSSSVYPNPAVGFTSLVINSAIGDKVTADINDSNGKVLVANVVNERQSSASAEHKLDISSLSSGVYTIVVYVNGENRKAHKLIVIE